MVSHGERGRVGSKIHNERGAVACSVSQCCTWHASKLEVEIF